MNFNQGALKLAIEFAGAEHILAGSDYPHKIGSIPSMLDAIAALPVTDDERLAAWVAVLRSEGLAKRDASMGLAAGRVGELAVGTPYKANTLDAYIKAGGDPAAEPLEVSLTMFDCVTLVESCLALARLAATEGEPTWEGFGKEIERMRYRGGVRTDYASRLHYFSEWISDGATRLIAQ